MNKKFIVIFLLLFVIGNICNNIYADDPPGWINPDPAPIPLPGIVYFLIAALAVGAKKLYNARNKF